MVAERRGRLSRTNGSCLPSVGLTAELGGALGGDRDLMSEGCGINELAIDNIPTEGTNLGEGAAHREPA